MNFKPLFILTILVSSIGLGSWRTVEPEPTGKIQWITLEEAAKLQETKPRKIMIDVYTDWCGWCKKMDATTFRDAEVVEYVNQNFYAVKLNAEQKEPITLGGRTFEYVATGRRGYNQVANELLDGKMSYPTTVFLNENMQVLQRIPGYIDTPTMKPILAYLATESFKTTKWADYQKEYYN